jgi:hypothetical protein
MAWAADNESIQVVFLDYAVEMDVRKSLAGIATPVA